MIDEDVFLHQPNKIAISATARVDRWVRINGGDGCTIGEYCHIATGSVINAGNGYVEMHDHSGCSNGVVIAGGMPDLRYEPISAAELPAQQHPLRLRTIIGKYVVIFANATVCPGVTVGDYAVVGAGAVVTKDVPPYAVALGVPARVVGYRRLNLISGEYAIKWLPKLRDLAAERDIARVRAHYGEQLPEALAADLVEFVNQLEGDMAR